MSEVREGNITESDETLGCVHETRVCTVWTNRHSLTLDNTQLIAKCLEFYRYQRIAIELVACKSPTDTVVRKGADVKAIGARKPGGLGQLGWPQEAPQRSRGHKH